MTNPRLDSRPVGKKNSKPRDALKNLPGNETSRPTKNTSKISRSRQIFQDPHFSRYHSIPLVLVNLTHWFEQTPCRPRPRCKKFLLIPHLKNRNNLTASCHIQLYWKYFLILNKNPSLECFQTGRPDIFYNLLKNSPFIELVILKELVVVNPTQ